MKAIFLMLLSLTIVNRTSLAQKAELINTSAKASNTLQIGFHLMNLEDDKFSLDYLKLEYQKNVSKHSAFSTSFGFAAYTKYATTRFFPSLHLPEEDIKGFN